MTTPNSLPLSPFTTIPHELVIDIFSHLDIVSVFSFLDSSRFHRRLLLSLRPVWTTIVLDPEVKMKVEEIYSTLRRLKYENGLREVVERVIMDGVDDHFSPDPVVMIYKFPNLRYLSATSRRRTTSLMALTQMLRDTLEGGSIPAGSLALRVLRIHHDYMDNKERVEPLAAVLAKLAGERIELDIRECAHKGCKTVVKVKPAVCGGCRKEEGRCWKCVDRCEGCGRRRFPPYVKNQDSLGLSEGGKVVGKGEEDMYILFE